MITHVVEIIVMVFATFVADLNTVTPQSAPMETSDWLVVLYPMRDVWRSVKTRPGVLCVMIIGILLMLLWLADSWDSLEQVNILLSCLFPVDFCVHCFILYYKTHARCHGLLQCKIRSWQWCHSIGQCGLHWFRGEADKLPLWQPHCRLLPLWRCWYPLS